MEGDSKLVVKITVQLIKEYSSLFGQGSAIEKHKELTNSDDMDYSSLPDTKKEESALINRLASNHDLIVKLLDTLKQDIRSAKTYEHTLKSLRIALEMKIQMDKSLRRFNSTQAQIKKLLQLHPRIDDEQSEKLSDDQILAGFQKMILMSIEEVMDYLHFLKLKWTDSSSGEETQSIAVHMESMLEGLSKMNSYTNSIPEIIEFLKPIIQETRQKIQQLKELLDVSSQERTVEIGKAVKLVKKELTDFLEKEKLEIPIVERDEQQPPNKEENKINLLKKMLLSVLEQIDSGITVLEEEISKICTPIRIFIYSYKTLSIYKSLSVSVQRMYPTL